MQYSQENSQGNSQETIRFLTVADAMAHIQTHHQTYLHHTLRCPTNARLRTYASTQDFCGHLVPWVAHQKKSITAVVEQLQQACWSWRKLLCGAPWKLIQVDNRLEDGMPHTIHSAIVLPVWLVEALCGPPGSAAHTRAVETLVHERVHVMQKVGRGWFDGLYGLWGFKRVEGAPPRHLSAVHHIHATLPTRTNPDTPDQWVLGNRWYLFVHLPEDTRTMRSVEYYIVDLDSHRPTTDTKGTKCTNHTNNTSFQKLDDCKWYNTFYGGVGHCYHPDESSAVLLASLIMHDNGGRAGIPPNNDVHTCQASQLLVSWMNR